MSRAEVIAVNPSFRVTWTGDVEGSGNGNLLTACDYVRLNPVRADLLRSEELLTAYPRPFRNEIERCADTGDRVFLVHAGR
jgi:hypothetical protein